MSKLTKKEQLIQEVKDYYNNILVSKYPHIYKPGKFKSHSGKAFEEWLVNEVYGPLYGLNEEDIETSYEPNRANEKICDFVFQLENELHIFESKFSEKKNVPDKEVISEITDIVSWIDDEKTISKLPDYAKEKIQNFDLKNKNNTIVIHLITSSGTNETFDREWCLSTDKAREISKIANIKFEKRTASEVFNDYGAAQGTIEPKTQTFKFIGRSKKDRVNDLSEHTSTKMFSIILSGIEINEMVENHKHALFHENIRGYRGQNQVNKELLNTIAFEPENFILFNNGLTATSSNISAEELKDKTLICERFQIINGCQTASTISEFARHVPSLKDSKGNEKIFTPSERIEILRKLQVQLRVLDVGGKTEKKVILKNKIIKANNTQTTISISDFRSTDEVQVNIEKSINNNKNRKIYYKGEKNPKLARYFRKTQKIKQKTNEKAVKLTDITESVYCFENNPIEIYSNKSKLYRDEDNSPYWKVFGNDGYKTETLTSKRIESLFAQHFLHLYTEEIIKNHLKKLKVDKEDLVSIAYYPKRFFSAIFGKLCDELDIKEEILIATINGSIYKEDIFIEIIKLIGREIKSMFSNAIEQGKTPIIRNWMRQADNFNKLKSKMVDDKEALAEFRPLFNKLLDST